MILLLTCIFFANSGKKLAELYVRRNEIGSLQEIKYLKDLPNLRVLWLNDNPCADHELYRYYVIRNLPQVRKLDNQDVTQLERDAAEQTDFSAIDKRRREWSKNAIPTDGIPVLDKTVRAVSTTNADVPPQSVKSPSLMDAVHPNPIENAPSSSAAPPVASKNVLYAVLALLMDLDDDSLRVVEAEIGKISKERGRRS